MQMTTIVTNPQQTTNSTESVTLNTSPNSLLDTQTENDKKPSWITIGIIIVCVLGCIWLMYFAYGKFIGNSKERFIKDLQQERDDPVVDYNLRDSIAELENIQRSILKKITSDVGI